MAHSDIDRLRLLSSEAAHEVAILPLMSTVPFPEEVVTIHVGHPANVQLIRDHPRKEDIIVLAYTEILEHWEGIEPSCRVGVAAKILSRTRLPSGGLQVTFQTLARVIMRDVLGANPYHKGYILLPEEHEDLPEYQRQELEVLVGECFSLVKNLLENDTRYSKDLLQTLSLHLKKPGLFADLLASNLHAKAQDKQRILEAFDLKTRLERVIALLQEECDRARISQEIDRKVKDGVRQTQREFYLRQQLKAIREELGEEEGSDVQSLFSRAQKVPLPQEAREVVRQQLDRLRAIPPASAEFAVISGYLDWILSLPWGQESPETLDIPTAAKILEEEHYGLISIKERILEYLSVRKLRPRMQGPILCLCGPPGTGKTSIGRAIATAVGRKFMRFSVGGVRDEAEIRGHRRTYVGALPGKLVQALRRVGVMNPVLMIDEIDKLSRGGQGDPAAALLEVLDPEQNHGFVDHYLDLPLDLSRVMFIATANSLHDIPAPLLDRMEVLTLAGYTDLEKKHIARRHLVPRQVEAHGLHPHDFLLSDKALESLIQNYTREAGLRNLDRQIETLCRKLARKRAEGSSERFLIEEADLIPLLGAPRHPREQKAPAPEVGVATGLAWTPNGGDLLFVEAQVVPGGGRLVLTGKLGDVLKESAQAALTYVRFLAQTEEIPPETFSQQEFHLHFPSGAIPKDGPSAGVAITLALLSRITGRPVRHDVAVTGEITLRGKVLPVGGVKEKLLAAQRAGISTVLLPQGNQPDLFDVPEEVKEDLEILFIEHVDQAIQAAITSPEAGALFPGSSRDAPASSDLIH